MKNVIINVKQGKELYRTGSLMVNGLLLTYNYETEYHHLYNEEMTSREIVRVFLQNGLKTPKIEEVSA